MNDYYQNMDLQQNPVEIISTLSQDIIHDISFDWYGKRIATCSSDKTIRFFLKNSEGKWIQQNSIKVQGGPLWRVKWARPQFGLIIATCSLDRNVKIYEKKKNEWIEQFKITDTKQGIQDIKFSPRHTTGLLLATAASDGNLRIYQAQDTQNLKNWVLKHNVVLNQLGLNCLSWNKHPFEKMMIAVGCKDLKTTYKKTIFNLIGQNKQPMKINTTDPTLSFLMYNQTQWVKLDFPAEQKISINDVSWSLTNGRSYHLLAICSDKSVKIFYFKVSQTSKKITITKIVQLDGCGIRLSWNIMVTHLAVSEPKKIRIYKSTNFNWNEVKKIEQGSE